MSRFQFSAFQVYHRKQYYRPCQPCFSSCKLGTSDRKYDCFVFFWVCWWKDIFSITFGSQGNNYYLLLFFGSVIFSSLWSLYHEKNNFYYTCCGALPVRYQPFFFTAIFFDPWSRHLFSLASCRFPESYLEDCIYFTPGT